MHVVKRWEHCCAHNTLRNLSFKGSGYKVCNGKKKQTNKEEEEKKNETNKKQIYKFGVFFFLQFPYL